MNLTELKVKAQALGYEVKELQYSIVFRSERAVFAVRVGAGKFAGAQRMHLNPARAKRFSSVEALHTAMVKSKQ